MTEYMPTTAEVRWCYRSEGRSPKGGKQDQEFDRWFAPYAEALAAVQRARELHQGVDVSAPCPDRKADCTFFHYALACRQCGRLYPCPTIKALEGEQE